MENISNLKKKFEIESQEIVNNHKKKIQFKNRNKGLTFGYGQKNILKDINLDLLKVIFMNSRESGVGKTTLIDLILGLLIPSKGNIFVNGSDIIEEKILRKTT